MTIPPVVCILIIAALAIWLRRRAEARRHQRLMDRLMGVDTPAPKRKPLRFTAPQRLRTAATV